VPDRVSQRVGLGFDVHPFDPDRPLVLGGVRLPTGPGLAGHSDADVVTHALADALLGAARLGDLGTRFPASDQRYRDAFSLDLLRQVVTEVRAAGWEVVDASCVLVAEVPRLQDHREAIEESLSAVLAAPCALAPKRAEGLGALGRAEGMAAFAVALLGAGR
jgi:2-C-methyl-D-erythritol 2,4-cyclodiphosphate synthase